MKQQNLVKLQKYKQNMTIKSIANKMRTAKLYQEYQKLQNFYQLSYKLQQQIKTQESQIDNRLKKQKFKRSGNKIQ